MLMLSGEPMPRVLMQVVRFCINTDDHELKKVIMLYWEVVPKYAPSRKLLPEMILVTNNLRNDLNHANEYIRGCTLRFLCKLKEAEKLFSEALEVRRKVLGGDDPQTLTSPLSQYPSP